MTSEPDQAGVATVPGHALGAIAWITLATEDEPTARAPVVGHALRQLGRAIRADDCICPVSSSRIAVQFGPVASVVPLEVLGDRLARAVETELPFADAGRAVAVGMAASATGESPELVTRRARSAARSSARALSHRDPRLPRCSAAITVNEVVLPTGNVTTRGTAVSLQRRTVHRQSSERADERVATASEDRAPEPAPCGLCILVVDPMVDGTGIVGFGARNAVAVAEQLGYRVAATGGRPDEPPTVAVDGVDVDLVVVVLDGAWVGRSPNWSEGSWGHPSRLTSAYVDKGVPVLAVGAGAGAGALAACVAQGALALFGLDRLADALCSLDGFTLEEARQVAEPGFPSHFRSLLGLTAGERRVLFYLTEGWTAQDIADELVVSLTTVRSHIRSVLRKLEVRSQLAAVAIANSRDLDHHQVVIHS
jgi:DNA-binding CsgD family transcriptional regulator